MLQSRVHRKFLPWFQLSKTKLKIQTVSAKPAIMLTSFKIQLNLHGSNTWQGFFSGHPKYVRISCVRDHWRINNFSVCAVRNSKKGLHFNDLCIISILWNSITDLSLFWTWTNKASCNVLIKMSNLHLVWKFALVKKRAPQACINHHWYYQHPTINDY